MAQVMYFILDTAHADFNTAKAEAEAAQQAYVGANTNLSCRYSLDGTKACMKVKGGTVDWYENSQWYNHPGIISVYTNENDVYPDHSELLALMATSDWSEQDDDDQIPEEYQ